MRLDKQLQLLYPEKTRSQLTNLVKSERVFVNGKKITKAGFNVSDEDIIKVNLVTDQLTTDQLTTNKLTTELDVIYENEDFLVINKPKAVVVHPCETTPEELTLIPALKQHCGQNLSGISKDRPGIVHRLDKDTTGILIVAKNEGFHQYLAKQIEERKVKKTYLAIVSGHPQDGEINAPISRSLKDRKKMSVIKGGREALTKFKVLAYNENDDISLLELDLVTGRTHQIRVHLQAIHHSVVGDLVYGNNKVNQYFKKNYKISSQLLHAYNYSFVNQDGELLTFMAPYDKLFSNLFPDVL